MSFAFTFSTASKYIFFIWSLINKANSVFLICGVCMILLLSAISYNLANFCLFIKDGLFSGDGILNERFFACFAQ